MLKMSAKKYQSKYHIHLTSSERVELLQMVKTGKHKALFIQYANLLLGLDEGNDRVPLSLESLSAHYHCSTRTIERLRAEFCAVGMRLFDAKPARTRCDKKFDARVEANLIKLVCEEATDDRPQWTLQLLADRLVALEIVDSISRMSVCNLLKKTNLSLSKPNII